MRGNIGRLLKDMNLSYTKNQELSGSRMGMGIHFFFFHNVINWRRRKNAIKGLQLGGRWIEDPCRVKIGILDLFKKDSKKFLLRGQSLMEFHLIICKI